MARTIKTLVALDTNVSAQTVQNALPVGGEIEVWGVVEGFDEAWRTLQETATDLVIVACSGYSDRALYFIEGAVRENPS